MGRPSAVQIMLLVLSILYSRESGSPSSPKKHIRTILSTASYIAQLAAICSFTVSSESRSGYVLHDMTCRQENGSLAKRPEDERRLDFAFVLEEEFSSRALPGEVKQGVNLLLC